MGRSRPIRAFGGAWFDARLCDAASGGLCAADAGGHSQFSSAEQPVRGASREFRARRRRDDDGAAGAGARDGGRDGERRRDFGRGGRKGVRWGKEWTMRIGTWGVPSV